MENKIDSFFNEYKKINKIKTYKIILYVVSFIIYISIFLLLYFFIKCNFFLCIFISLSLSIFILYFIFKIKLSTPNIRNMINKSELENDKIVINLLKKYKLNNKKSLQYLLYVKGINYLSLSNNKQKFIDKYNFVLGALVSIYTLIEIGEKFKLSYINIISFVIISYIYLFIIFYISSNISSNKNFVFLFKTIEKIYINS